VLLSRGTAVRLRRHAPTPPLVRGSARPPPSPRGDRHKVSAPFGRCVSLARRVSQKLYARQSADSRPDRADLRTRRRAGRQPPRQQRSGAGCARPRRGLARGRRAGGRDRSGRQPAGRLAGDDAHAGEVPPRLAETPPLFRALTGERCERCAPSASGRASACTLSTSAPRSSVACTRCCSSTACERRPASCSAPVAD